MKFAVALLVSFTIVVTQDDSHALTVSWGNDLLSNDLQNASGGFLDSSFSFEVGTFADTGSGQPGTAVDPASLSYAALQDFWKPIDFAVSPAASGWDPAPRIFAGSANLTETAIGSNVGDTDGVSGSVDLFADPDAISGGEQMYVWVHNGTLHSGSNATEAALFTAAAWTIKDYETHTFPIEINLSDATINVVGDTNQAGFDLQTATVIPIPEPGICALLLLAAGALPLRRKRISIL